MPLTTHFPFPRLLPEATTFPYVFEIPHAPKAIPKQWRHRACISMCESGFTTACIISIHIWNNCSQFKSRRHDPQRVLPSVNCSGYGCWRVACCACWRETRNHTPETSEDEHFVLDHASSFHTSGIQCGVRPTAKWHERINRT